MKYAVLLHAGGLGRVPAAIFLAHTHNAQVYMGLECAEADAVRAAIGPHRVGVIGSATDTFTETVNVMPAVIIAGVTHLIVVTEPGHLGRAARIARILAWRRGVTILIYASAQPWQDYMTYRSPFRRTVLDAIRAAIYRVTGWAVKL